MSTEVIVAITSTISIFLTAIVSPVVKNFVRRHILRIEIQKKSAEVESQELDNAERLKQIAMSMVDPLHEQLKILRAAQEESERKIAALEGEIAELKSLLEAAKEKEIDLTAANEELKLKNAQLERELDHARNEIERLQKRVADLEARRNAKK